MGRDEKAIEKARPSTLAQYGSFDLEEMQDEAKHLPSGGGNYFKPTEGKNVIRLLPPPQGKKPFKTYHKHWFQMGGERKAIICTKYQYNQPCPICQQGAKLAASGNKRDVKNARAFNPQSAVYLNIVDMKNPERGVQIWQMSPGVFKGIMNAIDMAGVKNFADPVNGYNIIFKRTGSGMKTKYEAYSVAREATELPDWEELLAAQPDIETIEAAPSDEEQDEALDGEWVARDDDGTRGRREGGKATRSGSQRDTDDDEEDVEY